MKTRFIVSILLLFAIAAMPVQVMAQAKEGADTVPDPITISRKTNPLVIPDVPRDKIICFALYTVQDGVMKMNAIFYPLKEDESRVAILEVKKGSKWSKIAKADIEEIDCAKTGVNTWLASFRVEKWDQTKNFPYRVTHAGGSAYEGLIRRDPIEKDTISIAAFTGNSNSDRGMREDVVANIKALDPDMLFFSGDQSYEHNRHTAAWLLFGRQFGEIIKDRPTISIPDDHDVGQGNLWGENGKLSKLGGGADGGYNHKIPYVKLVERAQTGHMPDPYDPTPIERGISVYYTSINIGGIDFAIVEDRKFKTGPAGMIPEQGPRPDHINDPAYDRQAIDVPEGRILGDRQIKFLKEWGQDWDGAVMKAVLSQTIFAGGAHIHGQNKNRLLADMDSNGWPQTARNRAIKEMRRSFSVHIAGDQHLATVIRHGANSWEDSVVSFCVPSIVNYYGRWWWPLEKPLNHDPKNPLPFTGRFYDGFGNKITVDAYSNPTTENYNAAGFGIVKFKKSDRTITFECWPRHADVTDPKTKQHPGWPLTFKQEDNYGREALSWLPMIDMNGHKDPVVQVIDQYANEIVYTIRINGTQYRPRVFRQAAYTIKVTDGDNTEVFENVESAKKDDSRVLKAFK